MAHCIVCGASWGCEHGLQNKVEDDEPSSIPSTALLGPMPIPSLEYEIIVHQRSGQCKGCEWHPDVCKHCLQSLNDDNDNGSPNNSITGGEAVP